MIVLIRLIHILPRDLGMSGRGPVKAPCAAEWFQSLNAGQVIAHHLIQFRPDGFHGFLRRLGAQQHIVQGGDVEVLQLLDAAIGEVGGRMGVLQCPVDAGFAEVFRMDAFRDPSVRAVFSAIGGDDTIRLLPYVDLDVLRDNPKIFTGFSDTTSNHFMMHKAGLVSYYGLSVMCDLAEYVSINEYSREMMERTIFHPQPRLDIPCSAFCAFEKEKVLWAEENVNIPRPRRDNTGYEILQGSGKVEGELLGGCLDVFVELMGT